MSPSGKKNRRKSSL